MNIFLWVLAAILGIIGYIVVGGIVSRLAWWAWPLKGPRTVIRFLFFPMNVGFDLFPKMVGQMDPPPILIDYFKVGKRNEYVVASAWLWPLRIILLLIGCVVVGIEAVSTLLGPIVESVASYIMKAYKALVTPSIRRKKQPTANPPLSSVGRSLPAAASADLRVPQAEDQKTSQPA